MTIGRSREMKITHVFFLLAYLKVVFCSQINCGFGDVINEEVEDSEDVFKYGYSRNTSIGNLIQN